jgi:hypothetical protein
MNPHSKRVALVAEAAAGHNRLLHLLSRTVTSWRSLHLRSWKFPSSRQVWRSMGNNEQRDVHIVGAGLEDPEGRARQAIPIVFLELMHFVNMCPRLLIAVSKFWQGVALPTYAPAFVRSH